MILAVLAVLADLSTYLVMGSKYEINPFVQHFSPPMAIISKLALIVLVVGPVLYMQYYRAQLKRRHRWAVIFVPGLAFVLCSVGAISNALVIAGTP